jgi:hypothetical protein
MANEIVRVDYEIETALQRGNRLLERGAPWIERG